MPIFGQVWLWSSLAFLLGALLCWLLVARPARTRVGELEAQLATPARRPLAPERPELDRRRDDQGALVPGIGDDEDFRTRAYGLRDTPPPLPPERGRLAPYADQDFPPFGAGPPEHDTELADPPRAAATQYLDVTSGSLSAPPEVPAMSPPPSDRGWFDDELEGDAANQAPEEQPAVPRNRHQLIESFDARLVDDGEDESDLASALSVDEPRSAIEDESGGTVFTQRTHPIPGELIRQIDEAGKQERARTEADNLVDDLADPAESDFDRRERTVESEAVAALSTGFTEPRFTEPESRFTEPESSTPTFAGQDSTFSGPDAAFTGAGRATPTYTGSESSTFTEPERSTPIPSETEQPAAAFTEPDGSAPSFNEPARSGTSFDDPEHSAPSFGGPGQSAPSFGDSDRSGSSFGGPGQPGPFGEQGGSAPSFGGLGQSGTSFGEPERSGSPFDGLGEPDTSFGDSERSASTFAGSEQAAPSFGDSERSGSSIGGPGQSGTSFDEPGGSAPSFGGPGESAPSFGESERLAPTFGEPERPAAAFTEPEAPSFGEPAPSFGESAPAFGEPDRSTPAFTEPPAPTYAEAGRSAHALNEPVAPTFGSAAGFTEPESPAQELPQEQTEIVSTVVAPEEAPAKEVGTRSASNLPKRVPQQNRISQTVSVRVDPTPTALPKRVPSKPRHQVPFGVQPSSTPEPATPTDQPAEPARSLFEPIIPAEDEGMSTPPPPHRLRQGSGGGRGPFGPGSAMPLPGGASPSPEFTIKASVAALRYCTPESPQFGRTVAEVWFRTAADAERVGFRPVG